MRDLSILIPARAEVFLKKTLDDILAHREADTEVIAVLDGYWPDPPIPDNDRVTLIHHTTPIGQRGGTNEAARVARGRFVMKCDAHCAFDQGFDRKLLEPYDSGELDAQTTTIPRMFNLHAFDWVCEECGLTTEQGPQPGECPICHGKRHRMKVAWVPKWRKKTDFARFDRTLHFQYWHAYKHRPEAQGDIAEVMSSLGACWMMSADRFFRLGGLDEAHGSWGQVGVEVACKSWLSGGRQVVNKRTWFSHLFRSQWRQKPVYPITEAEIQAARVYSARLWAAGTWPLARYPLSWLIEKFKPIPDWHDSELTPSMDIVPLLSDREGESTHVCPVGCE